MLTLEELNAQSPDAFVATLGGIYEHSPWVAQRVVALRPFATRAQLQEAMRAAVASASEAEQLALIRAHPQLGARGRARAELSAASAREQQRAGLALCTSADWARLDELNAAYLAKFEIPFILAVRGHTPASIIDDFERRLANDAPQERAQALRQIDLIAHYRLIELLGAAETAPD
jgi:OHCU decarboxylase